MNEEIQTYIETVANFQKQNGITKSTWSFACCEDFVLQNGIWCNITDETFEGKRKKSKECFKNAFQLVQKNFEDLVYVEGYANSVIPTLHAWAIDKEGNVIDPTWRSSHGYFGVPFKFDYVARTLHERGLFGIIDNMQMSWPFCLENIGTFFTPISRP